MVCTVVQFYSLNCTKNRLRKAAGKTIQVFDLSSGVRITP